MIAFVFIEEIRRGPGRPPTYAEAGEREFDMRDRYKSGETLKQIGRIHGITRERVRQLIKKHFALSKYDGGRYIGQFLKTDIRVLAVRQRQSKRELKAFKVWGMSDAEYIEHVAEFGKYIPNSTSPMSRFCRQRENARIRKIQWGLTFKNWWRIWRESGKWHLRGRGQGKYVMARWDNTDGYCEGNVLITPSVSNNSKTMANKSGLPMGVRATQNKFAARKMVGGKLYCLGTFNSADAAHAAYLAFEPPKRNRRKPAKPAA